MNNKKTNNLTYLKDKRKELRKNITPAEATLWNSLKNKQLEGRKFRRQHSINNYILDFYCPSEKLVVELDGDHHFSDQGLENDQLRDAYLKSLGIKVLRFENDVVFWSIEYVLETIKNEFNYNHPLAHPS